MDIFGSFNIDSISLTIFAIFYLFPSIYGIYMVKQNESIYIYSDYTDILMTIIFIISPFVFIFIFSDKLDILKTYQDNVSLLSASELSTAQTTEIVVKVCEVLFILFAIFLGYKAISINEKISIFKKHSIVCAKFFFPLLIIFVFIIYVIINAEPQKPKRENFQTRDEFEVALAKYQIDYQKWQDKKDRNNLLLAGAIAGLIYMMTEVTKNKNFAGLKSYFNLRENRNITNKNIFKKL